MKDIFNATEKRLLFIIFASLIITFAVTCLIYWQLIKPYYLEYKDIQNCSYVFGINFDSFYICMSISVTLSGLLTLIVLLKEKNKGNRDLDYSDISNEIRKNLVWQYVQMFYFCIVFARTYSRIKNNINNEWEYKGTRLCLYGNSEYEWSTVFIVALIMLVIGIITFYMTSKLNESAKKSDEIDM